jgi:cytochrome c oxidase subunit 2
MKLDKDIALLGILVLIVGFVFVPKFLGNSNGSGSIGLTGNVIGLDVGRIMAGAPCHKMGGGFMGDCETREINLEAWKYEWNQPIITVKSGELVRIRATTKDDTHGIAIPAVNFNLVIETGKVSVGEFIAPAPGEYAFGCSVICGPGHMDHKGKLVVI